MKINLKTTSPDNEGIFYDLVLTDEKSGDEVVTFHCVDEDAYFRLIDSLQYNTVDISC